MSSTLSPTSLGDPADLILRTFGARPFHTDGDLVAVRFAPDGSLWSVEEPGVLRNWNLGAQKMIDWHPLDEIATVWCFSHTAHLVAAGSNELSIWESASGEMKASWTQAAWVTAIAFSPDARLVATGHDDGAVRIWDWASQKVLHELREHEMAISAVLFSPDGKRLASAAEDRLIRLWQVDDGSKSGTLTGHTDRVPAMVWHPDGRRLISAGWDTTARVWDTQTCEPIILLNSHAGQVHTLALSTDGNLLACADSDNAIHIWDVNKSKTLGVVREQGGETYCLAFSPDGQKLAAGGTERVIHLWDTIKDAGTHLPEEPHLTHTAVAVAPNGRRLFSLGAGTALRIWDTETTESAFQLKAYGPVRSFAASPDGRWVAASLNMDNNPNQTLLALWKADTGQRVIRLEGQNDPVTCLAFRPDSAALASASFQSADVWLWSVPQGEPLLLIPNAGDGCAIENVAFHPQGRLLAVTGIDYMSTSGVDGQVALWDVEDKKQKLVFRGGATAAAFHPSGNWLAVASLVQSIRIYELSSREQVNELTGHAEAVACLAYSPDGRWLASGGDDRTLRLWEATTGTLRGTVELDSQVKAVAFSPDGRYLFTGNGNTSCYQFDVGQLVADSAT
jgi:WD40 repeat protein